MGVGEGQDCDGKSSSDHSSAFPDFFPSWQFYLRVRLITILPAVICSVSHLFFMLSLSTVSSTEEKRVNVALS